MGTGVFSSGFGNPKNTAAFSAAIFNGWLYIGTMNWFDGCEIWRTNGTVWQRVIGNEPRLSSYSNGFGDDDRGFERDIYAWEMLVYNDSQGEQLYVGTFNIAGCELWRTSNGLNWECLVGENGILQRGFNERVSKLSTHNYGIRRMRIFNNTLYMGSASTPAFTFQYNKKYPSTPLLDRTRTFEFNLGQGCSIWRYNGSTLSRIIGGYGTKNCCNGFGDQTNAYIWSLIEYDGRLFAGTMNPGTYCVNITSVKKPLRRPVITFELVNKKSKTSGFGGCEIWYTNDGEGWYQIVGNEAHQGSEIWPQNGFGDKNNVGARAFVMYQNSLYVGIMNGLDGCEVWRFNGSSYPDEPLTCIKQKRITFESGRHTLYGEIYYPADEKQKYPGIIFCEGYASYTDAYSWIPQALAEQGYVVLIFDPPGLGQSEGIFRKRGIKIPLLNLFIRSSAFIETPIQYFLRNWVQATSDALTYLLEDSPVIQLIDNTHIGLIGHSLGGITVTETAAKDNRINAVVTLSHGNSFSIRNIDVPIQFQCGGSDLLSWSFLVLRSCYRKASTPKELIVIKRGSHWGFTTAFDSHCPCPEWQKDICLLYAIGWFDYFLKNKPDAYNTITTGSQHLSKLLKSRYNFGEGEQILK
jgi:pimeloyl-ACP methyl ester carboxylesterase